ncbi:MAG: phytanoyl-CoA dioxygenase family protein [Terriglobales bacterium]
MVRIQAGARGLALPFALPAGALASYRGQGFVQLHGVLADRELADVSAAIAAHVAARRRELPPMAERSTYDRAFVQVMNLWRNNEVARTLVFSRRLAGIAAGLLEVNSVRLYHDQALYKEPGGGATPWHADQYYWPLSSDRCVTAWIPLQATPLAMGPLAFSPGSHRLRAGRDLAIGDESEAAIGRALADRPMVEAPFAPGDVSFHSGWTFHRAGPNTSTQPRQVMTIIYMDAEMRLAPPTNANQEADRATWCPGIEIGATIASPLNPVLYP